MKIAVLQTKVGTWTERVETATAKNTAANDRYTAEEMSYAAYMSEFNAHNDRIDFELGILDQAEAILANEGIERAGAGGGTGAGAPELVQ